MRDHPGTQGTGAGVTRPAHGAPVRLVQIRGVATYVERAPIASISLSWNEPGWSVSPLRVIDMRVTHAPERIRHYSVKHQRVLYTDGNG